jgi:hypothetical protein
MNKPFNSLNINDTVSYVMLCPSCDEEDAYRIGTATLIGIEKQLYPIRAKESDEPTEEHDYTFRFENGREYKIRLFTAKWHPFSNLVTDSEYQTGNLIFATEKQVLVDRVNAEITKEVDMLKRRMERIQQNIDALESRRIA